MRIDLWDNGGAKCAGDLLPQRPLTNILPIYNITLLLVINMTTYMMLKFDFQKVKVRLPSQILVFSASGSQLELLDEFKTFQKI